MAFQELESRLITMKRTAEAARDKYVKDKATYDEVLRSIERDSDELRKLGFDPDKVEEQIAEKLAQISSEVDRLESVLRGTATSNNF